ncbi:MAG: hypothetical protein HYS52_01715 [Candidatus Wildermuthbacteria bacterium]|nr:hypothetical protein [Candidatus Wildermuthbacteria bacterium]
MDEAKTIELTREETYALESVLKNDDTEEGVRVAKALILKIGSALMQQNQEGAESALVTIAMTEREAWLARDRIPITMQIGHQPVGLSIKKKIYRILLEFDTESKAGDMIRELDQSIGRDQHASKNKPRHYRKARHDAGAPKKAGS